MKTFSLILSLILVFGCHRQPKVSKEMKKVLEHYKSPEDSLKLKAAVYLIENMEGKYSKTGNFLKPYIEHYKQIKLREDTSAYYELAAYCKESWPSLIKEYPEDILTDITVIPDHKAIKASLLIENIDLAFEAWEQKPWARHVNFEDFCEYILPYRVGDEPLTNWRRKIIEDYTWVNSLENETDPLVVSLYVTKFIEEYKFNFITELTGHPNIGMSDMHKYPYGVCENRLYYILNVKRALGIASSIDYTPAYNRWNGNHSWGCTMDTLGNFRPYYGSFADTNKIQYGHYGGTKAYRNTFSKQNGSLAERKDAPKHLPEIFRNGRIIDVTSEYAMKKIDLDFQITQAFGKKIKYGFLATFTTYGRLAPVAWAEINNSSVLFRNVSPKTVYLPFFFYKQNLRPVGFPVIFRYDSLRTELKPSEETQQVTLYRKFPTEGLNQYGTDMIGARFQVSDSRNFKNATTIHTISKMNEYLEEGIIEHQNSHRYIRYLSAPGKQINVAEIEIFGLDKNGDEKKLSGKIIGSDSDTARERSCKRPFDGDIKSYFLGPPSSWAGLDLGKPVQITRVKYLGRNNMNVIEPGDTYELFYYGRDGWNSLGRQIPEHEYVKYNEVPKDALLLLRNLSKGKEERVFIYENGEQIFW